MAIYDVAMGSGGTKGVAFAGALEVLQSRGHSVGRVLGCSAGAISAALFAAGYSGRELAAKATEEGPEAFGNFLSLPSAEDARAALARPDSETRRVIRAGLRRSIESALDRLTEKLPRVAIALRTGYALRKEDMLDNATEAFIGDGPGVGDTIAALVGFLEFGGFFSSDAFVQWLAGQIRGRVDGFTPDWSFERFHATTGSDLSVVVSDTSARESLILNHRTSPDCPVVEAVRMSISIPMVWAEVAWQAGWGKYRGTGRTGHWIVDGGATRNLPIHLFADADDPEVRSIMGPPAEGARPLGLMLDDTLPVAGDVAPPQGGSKLIGRIGRLVDTVTQWEEEWLRPYAPVICRIPTLGYDSMEFAISSERIGVLINSGRCAMGDHLRSR